MRNGWRGAFVMGLEIVALAMGVAWAADGWIGFSGAVVMPTCGAMTPLATEPDKPVSRQSCRVGGGGAEGAEVVFRSEIEPLTGHETDPLLAAYAGAAVASSSGRSPVLVVRTYP